MVFKKKDMETEDADYKDPTHYARNKEAGLKSPSRRKSAGRPKSPSRVKSPGRTKSPGRPRSPGRSKSPGRKGSPVKTKSATKSRIPARKSKSPSRTTKESTPLQASTPIISFPEARVHLHRSAPTVVKSYIESTSVFRDEKISLKSRNQRAVEPVPSDSDEDEQARYFTRGRSRASEDRVDSIVSTNDKLSTRFGSLRRPSTRYQTREVERVIHVSNSDKTAKKLGEFSDEDDIKDAQFRKSQSVEQLDFKQVSEFGGVFGTLLFIFTIPITGILLFASCDASQCSFSRLPAYSKFLSANTYFDLFSILGVFAFAIILAILSILPFGGKKLWGLPTKQGKFFYVMNGCFVLFITVAIVISMEFKKIHILNFIVKHVFHLFVGAYLVGLLLSIFVYIRSFYVPINTLNAQVLGKNGIYGFFLGREINPRIAGNLDLKFYVLRWSCIGVVLLNIAYVFKSLEWTDKQDWKSLALNPTLLVAVIMQTIYLLDGIIYEHVWLTSFEILYEGFGYMSATGYLVFPFLITSITKYIFDYKIQLETWKLITTAVVFFIGYLFYRGSNNQKDTFRRNPYDSSLSNLETIPTSKGKKLLCSGFWGIVRHPNYLGDILINLAFAPFVWNVPPVLHSIVILLILFHRTFRNNIYCKNKYGAAWDRYCNKVKYILIPKVY